MEECRALAHLTYDGVIQHHSPALAPEVRILCAQRMEQSGISPAELNITLSTIEIKILYIADVVRRAFEAVAEVVRTMADALAEVLAPLMPDLQDLSERIENLKTGPEKQRFNARRHRTENQRYQLALNTQRRERLRWSSAQHARFAVRF